jgi:hypothetical protein
MIQEHKGKPQTKKHLQLEMKFTKLTRIQKQNFTHCWMNIPRTVDVYYVSFDFSRGPDLKIRDIHLHVVEDNMHSLYKAF